MKDKLRKRSILWYLFISIAILCSSVFSVSAQDANTLQGNRAVASLSIVNVDGDAEILSKLDVERSRGESRILGDAWKPALPRTPLSAGDQIRTGARGSLQLQLGDGTLVTLAGDSVAVVEELRSARGESPQTTQIKLEQGRLSTQQTTKILGQTNQIIRTDNGTVNTSLGEIEVWKPSAELPRIALVGDLPLLAQKAPKNETRVNLSRGGATVMSSGVGRIVASSMTTPETCIDEDGVKFTLVDPNQAVTITRLEDEHAYILTSKKQFYVLVATEGTVNSVDIITQDSDAKIDIEGIAVAEQNANELSYIKLHPLLTVGVQTYAVKIKFGCDDTTPRGLNQFDILGDATVLRTSFGLDTDRPLPSGSSGSGRLPQETPTPTPTPTPEEYEEIEEPTPEIPDKEPPISLTGPTRIPVTHTNPREPEIRELRIAAQLNGYGCTGPDTYYVEFQFDWQNYLPSVMGGHMEYRFGQLNFTGYSPNYYAVPGGVYTLFYAYPVVGPVPTPWDSSAGIQQLEIGTYGGSFCYVPAVASTDLYFQVALWDLEGNFSGFYQCVMQVDAAGAWPPPGITCP